MPGGDIEVHAFADAYPFAAGFPPGASGAHRAVEVHTFPDGESRVRVQSDGARHAIVVRSLDQANRKLLEVLFAADALRRRGVQSLALVAPYLGYMRQDRAFRAGEAVSQQVVGRLLGDAFDVVLTLEAHLHRIRRLSEVVPCQASSVSAAPLIGRWCREQAHFDVVVGPDVESAPWIGAVAETAALPPLVYEKVREGDRAVRLEGPPLPAGARSALVVDDIASTGETLVAVARDLKARGILRVEAAVVHALFDPAGEARLLEAGIDRIVSSDTLSHPSNAIATGAFLASRLPEGFAPRGIA
ncbi:MAG: ribose-phosphate diphosphokinase [Myxococcales bacterium]|nr:ribose-phosphate diphosphokinase [Myxococcales bacterium]